VLLNIREKLHSVILRFPAVYGPRDRDILKMMKAAKNLRIMPVFGGTFSTVHVQDAARAALLAAERTVPSGSVYFISDGNCYTYDHVAEVVDRSLGIRPVRLKMPAWLVRAAGWVSESLSRDGSIFNRDKARELSQPCWVCAPDKARAELGYQPEYNLERGMGETIKWYQEQGWL
jgi:nucleoside-diphosphate-sugar epimerase